MALDFQSSGRGPVVDDYSGIFGLKQVTEIASTVLGREGVTDRLVEKLGYHLRSRRVNGEFVRRASAKVFAVIELEASKRKKKEHLVRAVLDEESQRTLVADWGMFRSLKFRPQGVAQCHGKAAETRKLELMKLVDYVNGQGYGRIKLVGENVLSALPHFPNAVRACIPNMDMRDVATRNVSLKPTQLAALVKRHQLTAQEFEKIRSVGFISHKLAQDDDEMLADCLVGRQVYIDKLSAAQACDAARAKEFVWSVILPNDLMTRVSADGNDPVKLESIGGYYRFITENGKRRIAFDFADFCQGYVHDLDDYVSLTQESVIETPHAVYHYSIIMRYGDVAFVKVSVVPDSILNRELPRQVEIVKGPKRLIVKSWSYVPGQRVESEYAFKPIKMEVEADIFFRVVNMFMTLERREVKIQDGVRLLRALNASALVHGDSIGPLRGILIQDMFPLAVAAALVAVYTKTRGEQVLKENMALVSRVRSLSEKKWSLPFVAIYETICTGWSNLAKVPQVKSIFSALGLTNVYGKWSSLYFSNTRHPVQLEVVDIVRWLDKAPSGSLAEVVTIQKYLRSDRQYKHERILPTFGKLKVATTLETLTLEERVFVQNHSDVRFSDDGAASLVQSMNRAVEEAKLLNERAIVDCLAATRVVQNMAFPVVQVLDRRNIERTWDGSSSKITEIVGVVARQGKVVEIFPENAVVDHMYLSKVGTDNFESFVKLERVLKLGDDLPDGPYVTWSGLKIAVDSLRKKAFDAFTGVNDIKGLKATALTGAAGGGKTFKLVEQIKKNSLILASTRRGKQELYEEVTTKQLGLQDKQVRTLDSYLTMGRDWLQTPHLIQDECYQQHFGFLVLAMFLASGANGVLNIDVLLSGDKVQIPFINRSALLLANYEIPDVLFSDSILLTKSHRMPQDSVLANREVYSSLFGDEDLKTFSEVERSMSIIKFETVESIPKLTDPKNQQYITMTHNEKNELIHLLKQSGLKVGPRADVNKGIVGVNVPGEIQGLTVQHAVIVRRYETALLAYNNSGPNLVATTRHTHKCQYVTLNPGATGDQLLDKFRTAMSGSQFDLQGCYESSEHKKHTAKLPCSKCRYDG